MKHLLRAIFLLIILIKLGSQGVLFSQEESASRIIQSIQFTGGSEDDHLLAKIALGLKIKEIYQSENKDLYIAAIKQTDRFKQVEITVNTNQSGLDLQIALNPWPMILSHQGLSIDNINSALAKEFRRLPVNRPIGDLELEKYRREFIRLGSDYGYPHIQLSFSRSETASTINWNLNIGHPNRIEKIIIKGLESNLVSQKIEALLKLENSENLWSEHLRSRLSQKIEKVLLKERYFQSSFSFSFEDSGSLNLQVILGFQTKIHYQGELLGPWVGTPTLEEILGLTALNSSNSDLVEVSKFRLEKYFKNVGYLNVQVDSSIERIENPNSEIIQVLRIEVKKGSFFSLGPQVYRGNTAFSTKDLNSFLAKKSLSKKPRDPFETIKIIQNELISFYDAQGYLKVRILPKTELDISSSLVNVSWIIEEGSKQQSNQFELDYAKGLPLTPDYLRSSLSLLLMRQATESDFLVADRPLIEGRKGRFEATAKQDKNINLTLYLNENIPVSQATLSEVLSDLRFKLVRSGFNNPQVKIDIEDRLVRFYIPYQHFDTINRIIVRGVDTTRANTVLQQLKIEPGFPVDPQRLIASQINLSLLNAFDQIDFDSMDKIIGDKTTWNRGDILLDLEEKGRWNYTTGFGYDRSQGYFVIGGIQRNNIDGQGRTVDLNIRAGNNTLRNETLRKWFPTGQGQNNRSIDSYALGYTDPSPGFINDWFNFQVNWRNQGAYIEESQAAYFARRRVLISEFEWRTSNWVFKVGERFERTDFNPQSYQINLLDFLLEVARTNKQTYTISAPYLIATVDQRDRPIDPTRGLYLSSRIDLATQLTGTSRDSSFIKIDLRGQWNFPIGFDARFGVFMISGRLGVVKPTMSAIDLPLSERFYGGGPNSVRGVGSDLLGPVANIQLRDIQGQPLQGRYQFVPTGGEVLGFTSLEYRFPLWRQDLWGEIFIDSGQVYSKLNPLPRSSTDPAPFPAWRTTLGVGLIFKIGIPLKIEYAQDLKKLFGLYRTPLEIQTELRGVLVSAGFQF